MSPEDVFAPPLAEQYRARLRRYGPGHEAVQWSSPEAQARRFAAIADALLPTDSIIDVGCGLGCLLRFLRRERGFRGRYLGLDFVAEFVAHARARFAGDARAEFRLFDARRNEFPAGYASVVACGLFNNRIGPGDANGEWLRDAVARMYARAERLVAFNTLSAHSTAKVPDLYYTDPAGTLAWASARLTRRVVLRHDYLSPPLALGVPEDYTLYLLRG